MKHRICILGSVWVEPNSSAAGSRMLQLIELFLRQGWEVFFATTASKSPNSKSLLELGVREHSIVLNDSSFDQWVQEINPTMVIFDRFMTEEQFGWRVAEACPQAMRILDTEDLHCLRKERQLAVKKNVRFNLSSLLESELAHREIAAIFRCDLSLIISPYEMGLLKSVFGVPDFLLIHIPFLFDELSKDHIPQWTSFQERKDFISIGNFLHPPNVDATLELKKEIWPKIKRKLPEANIHLYGSYPSQQVMELNNDKEGFFVHGYIEDADKAIAKSRVLLAPLRFGAGLKGKLTQAMSLGTPSVTTDIGSEGMHADLPWPGFIENNWEDFAEKSVELYTNESEWYRAQKNVLPIINTVYDQALYGERLIHKMTGIFEVLETHRSQNFIGKMLQHHTLKSYMYLGKWIEEKNKNLKK